MTLWRKQMPEWTSIVIWGIGIPATYYAIYNSNVGANLAHGQLEILDEKSASLTAVIWFTVTAGVLIVRYIVNKRTSKVEDSEKCSASSGSDGAKPSL